MNFEFEFWPRKIFFLRICQSLCRKFHDFFILRNFLNAKVCTQNTFYCHIFWCFYFCKSKILRAKRRLQERKLIVDKIRAHPGILIKKIHLKEIKKLEFKTFNFFAEVSSYESIFLWCIILHRAPKSYTTPISFISNLLTRQTSLIMHKRKKNLFHERKISTQEKKL